MTEQPDKHRPHRNADFVTAEGHFHTMVFCNCALMKLPFAPGAHQTRPERLCRSKSYRYFAFQAYYKLCGRPITSWATVIKWHLYMTKTKLTHTEIMIFEMRYESFLTFLYELVKHRSHLNLWTLWSAWIKAFSEFLLHSRHYKGYNLMRSS